MTGTDRAACHKPQLVREQGCCQNPVEPCVQRVSAHPAEDHDADVQVEQAQAGQQEANDSARAERCARAQASGLASLLLKGVQLSAATFSCN